MNDSDATMYDDEDQAHNDILELDIKCWGKYDDGRNVYYFVPSGKKRISRIYELDRLNNEEERKVFEKDLGSDSSGLDPYINQLNQDYCLVYDYKKIDKLERFVELPYGCYNYLEAGNSTPARLAPFSPREEFYLCNQDLFTYVTTDIAKFMSSRHIYDEMGMFYKRGYLLYSAPGCGKTAFVRYLIKQKFNEKCHLIWMDSVPSLSFIKALCVIPTLKVFVIEEITSYNKNPYDLKRLLEFLDGEKSVSNSIVIATTNYPKELEQNLADRPSRFDIPLEIKEPNEQETKVFFEYFLKRNLTKDEVTLSGLTVAHIKECCLLNKLYDLPLQQCYDKVLLTRTKFKDGFIVSKATGHYA